MQSSFVLNLYHFHAITYLFEMYNIQIKGRCHGTNQATYIKIVLIREFRDPPKWPSLFNIYTLQSRDIEKL